MTVDAVTFDFWNTLASEERGHLRGKRLEAWAGILDGTGYGLERQHLEAAFDHTWELYVSSWKANQQFRAAEAAVACVERLGLDVPSDVHAALVAAFTDAGSQATLHLTPHLSEVLVDLKSRGVQLAIVCDVGFTPSHTLRAHLEGAGVLGHFDSWAFSDEVGVYKPDAQIFLHALDAMGGVEPSRAAHIGDLRRTDIAGAKALGMTAVRFTGVFDDHPDADHPSHAPASPGDAPEADHVIDDMRRLPEVLGL